VTVRDLARVSPSAAYRHFLSRDHLMARVSQMAREALAAELRTAQHGTSTPGGAARRATARFEAAFIRCDTRPEQPDDPGHRLGFGDRLEWWIRRWPAPGQRNVVSAGGLGVGGVLGGGRQTRLAVHP
jgi:AcrR family transcriptional regulator